MASRAIVCRSARFDSRVLHRWTPNGTLYTSMNVRHLSSLPSASILPLHSTSLGLFAPFIQSHLDTIRQLPEVESALSDAEHAQEDSLQRAVDIFASISNGSNEHQAALALLAEVQQSRGKYQAAIATLQQLEKIIGTKDATVTVRLAQIKSHWLHGDLHAAVELCDDLLDERSFPTLMQAAQQTFRSPFQAASVLTAKAITRLFLAENLDDAFVMRDPFRMAHKLVEAHAPGSLHTVTALLNLGVAEIVYAEIVSRCNSENDHGVPFDAALRTWKQGLTMFKRYPKLNGQEPAAQLLQAKLACNMAWGVLNNDSSMVSHTDPIQKASEYAAESLGFYDKMDCKEGLGRALSLTASCYQQSGAAVTAQGLLETAIDQPCTHAPQKLQVRDSYLIYAGLCKDWERRERDAEKLEEKAKEINSSLPSTWQDKSVIHESLWFWTPHSFQS